MPDREIDDRDYGRILVALRSWAEGHPERDEPFMAIMGSDEEEQTLFTPREFLDEVERNTHFGRSYVSFVVSQAHEYHLPPEDFIYRAVEANR